MITAAYDAFHNAVILEFKGTITTKEAEGFFSDLDRVLPRGQKFALLTDFTGIDTIALEVKREIEDGMDLFDAMWVSEIFRVLPDPAMDAAFDIMSSEHYSKHPHIVTCRSREEAEAHLEKLRRKLDQESLS